jgi:translation elongation factor EF-1alpha
MGTIVVGKIEAGHIKKGQQVFIMPNKVNHSTVPQQRNLSNLTNDQ